MERLDALEYETQWHSTAQNVIRSGRINKSAGKDEHKKWNTRFATLNGASLSWGSSDDAGKATTTVRLEDVRSISLPSVVPSSVLETSNAFDIVTPERRYTFCGENAAESRLWHEAIKGAWLKHPQVMHSSRGSVSAVDVFRKSTGAAEEAVKSPRVNGSQQHYMALWDIPKIGERTIAMRQTDVAIGMEPPADGWVLVRHSATHEVGYVPVNHTTAFDPYQKAPPLPSTTPAGETTEYAEEALDWQRADLPLRKADRAPMVYEGDIYDDTVLRATIQAMELELLVGKLTQPNTQTDAKLLRVFLLTHQTFVSTANLLHLLERRFWATPAHAPGDTAAMSQFLIGTRRALQQKVAAFVTTWVATAPFDFALPAASKLLSEFCQRIAAHDKLAADIREEFAAAMEAARRHKREQSKRGEDIDQAYLAAAPLSILLTGTTLTALGQAQFHALEVARQLTLMDFELFAAIEPPEYLGQAWRKDLAPHLLKLIARFNDTCSWACTEILKNAKPPERAHVICFLLDVANNCAALQSYSAVMAVLSALNSAAITRLRGTWKLLPEEYEGYLRVLNNFMSMENNYGNYRAKLSAVAPPMVPYIGLILRDLTFVDDGNKTFVGEKRLVNLEKERMNAAIVEQILRMRSKPYRLHPAYPIQDYILTSDRWDDKRCFTISSMIEPKDMKEPGKKERAAFKYVPQEGNESPSFVMGERDAQFMQALESRMEHKVFYQGEYVFKEGDTSQEMYFVVSGIVCIDLPDGRNHIANQGEFFGEIALFLARPRTATVWAETNVELLVLTRLVADEVMGEFPDVLTKFRAVAEERLHKDGEIPKWMQKLATESVGKAKVDTDQELGPYQAFLDELLACMLPPRRYQAAEVVCNEGDKAEEMYFIAHGIVDVMLHDGRRFPLNAGMFFGEVGLFTGKPRMGTVAAQTDAQLLILGKDDCSRIVKKYPKLEKEFKLFAKERLKSDVKAGNVRPPRWMARLAQACMKYAVLPAESGERPHHLTRRYTQTMPAATPTAPASEAELAHSPPTASTLPRALSPLRSPRSPVSPARALSPQRAAKSPRAVSPSEVIPLARSPRSMSHSPPHHLGVLDAAIASAVGHVTSHTDEEVSGRDELEALRSSLPQFSLLRAATVQDFDDNMLLARVPDMPSIESLLPDQMDLLVPELHAIHPHSPGKGTGSDPLFL